MERDEARAALDGMDAARRQLAIKAANCPPWRHAAFGALLALLVTSQGFEQPWQAAMFVLGMGGVAWLAIDDRRRYGLFVNGYRKGKTLPVTLALLCATLAAMGGEFHARTAGLSLATKLGIGAIAFVIAVAASVTFSRIYRRELEGGA